MRIAMLGTRGVPASYSGFETCVEQLGSRLVQRGHQVTVYCRSHHVRYADPMYKGMRLVKLPTVANKYLDTIIHSFISSLHALTQPYDVALYFIAGNSLVTWIPRLAGQVTVLNVDGLDWRRQKWPRLAKRYIQFAERLSRLLPNAIVTDSVEVQRYYRRVYGAESTYIAYGSDVPQRPPGEYLARFGLRPQGYVLFVGRLVPENCAHHLVEAFAGLDTDLACVIVGDAAYAHDYIHQLKASAGPNVLFTGYLFGEGYHELGSHAHVFVETSEVGGTHPALIEAMAFGNCVVVNGTPENRETIGDAGFAYDGAQGASALRLLLQEILSAPLVLEDYRRRARERASAVYSWEAVTDRYEDLFSSLLRQKALRRPPAP
jgi:glycosyltransferase involved in cell wall biosynthesis